MCDVGTQNMESNFAVNLVGTRPINMPIELVQRIYDQVADFSPSTKIGYAFTEPLVYPHLEASLDYAKHKGLYTSLTTNALVLRQKSQMLVDTELNDLFISLDGPEAIHNEIRGHAKSFQKAIEGIEALMKFDQRPKISIFCCITEWNIGHLKEFLDFFRQFPIEHIGFMHTNFTPQSVADKHNLIYGGSYPATDSNVDEIDMSRMDMDQLWDEISSIKKTDYPFKVSFSPEISTRELMDQFYFKPEEKIGRICMDAFSNIMIKSDGSCIPAHGRCYQVDVGNIYEESLKNIWNSSEFRKFRQALIESGGLFPACSRCCSGFGS